MLTRRSFFRVFSGAAVAVASGAAVLKPEPAGNHAIIDGTTQKFMDFPERIVGIQSFHDKLWVATETGLWRVDADS